MFQFVAGYGSLGVRLLFMNTPVSVRIDHCSLARLKCLVGAADWNSCGLCSVEVCTAECPARMALNYH